MSERLTRAAYENLHTTVQALLASRADVAVADHLGQTALHWAARQGHEAVAQVLLEASAPVASCSKDGSTPLHLAADSKSPAVVRLLLAHRADAAAKARTGRTALHLAAEKGSAESVAAMLEVGGFAMLTLLDSRGEEPLMTAAARGHGSVIEVLVSARADPECKNRWGCTALQKAVTGGHGSAVAALLDGGADASEPARDGATPLQTAAEQGHVSVLEALLGHGVDALARMSGGRTALHIAAERGFTAAAAVLVQSRADVNARTDEAQTALSFAAAHGHIATVEKLLDSGANPWAADDAGHMPLHAAVTQGRVEVADMLIRRSAPVDAKDAAGRTPALLAVAARQDQVLRLLLRNGAVLPEEVIQKDMAISDIVADVECEPKAPPQPCMPPLRLQVQPSKDSPDRRQRALAATVIGQAMPTSPGATAQETSALEMDKAVDHRVDPDARSSSSRTPATASPKTPAPASSRTLAAASIGTLAAASSLSSASSRTPMAVSPKTPSAASCGTPAVASSWTPRAASPKTPAAASCKTPVAASSRRTLVAAGASRTSASSRAAPAAEAEEAAHPVGLLAEAAADLSAQARQLEEVRALMSKLTEAAEELGAAEAAKGAKTLQDCDLDAALDVGRPSSGDLQGDGPPRMNVCEAGSLGLTLTLLSEAVGEKSSDAVAQESQSRGPRMRRQQSDGSRAVPSPSRAIARPSPKEPFFEVMRRKGDGSMVVAWRRYFDVDGNGDLDFQEFCGALTALGFRGDVIELWQALESNTSSVLSLESFDPEAAKLINAIAKWCRDKFGGPTEVFKEIDSTQRGVLTRQGLVAGLRRLGLFEDSRWAEAGSDLVSETFQSEEGFLRHMYPVIDIWGHDLVTEGDFLFLEQDKQKNRRLKRQFTCLAERGKLPAGKQVSAASHLLSNLAKHSTPLGGKNWKQAGRAIDKHLGPAPTDLGPLPERRRERRRQRPPRMMPSGSAPELRGGLPAESEAASSCSGSGRVKEQLVPSASLPRLPGTPSAAGTSAGASATSSVLSRQRQRVRQLYSVKQVEHLPAVQPVKDLPASQHASAVMIREQERRFRRQLDTVGQRSLEVLGPTKSEDFFNPASALGLFQHYYNVQ